jgi:hypothetical protein
MQRSVEMFLPLTIIDMPTYMGMKDGSRLFALPSFHST